MITIKVNMFLCLIMHNEMETSAGLDVKIHTFSSAVDGRWS